MTHSDLKNKLDSVGYRVAYREFNKKVTPPYIIWFEDEMEKVSSDLKAFGKWVTYQVELYTLLKNPKSEEALEAVLDEIDPDNTAHETYIDTEKLYQKAYEITVFMKN